MGGGHTFDAAPVRMSAVPERLRSFYHTKPLCQMKRGEISLPASSRLKVKLCDELHQARRRGADDLAEVWVFDLAVDRCWTVELCMIEGVECLHPEVQ